MYTSGISIEMIKAVQRRSIIVFDGGFYFASLTHPVTGYLLPPTEILAWTKWKLLEEIHDLAIEFKPHCSQNDNGIRSCRVNRNPVNRKCALNKNVSYRLELHETNVTKLQPPEIKTLCFNCRVGVIL